MFVNVMAVIALIGVITIPIMERRRKKQELREKMHIAAEVIAKKEHQELAEILEEAFRDEQLVDKLAKMLNN